MTEVATLEAGRRRTDDLWFRASAAASMSPPRPPSSARGGVHAALASPVRRRLVEMLKDADGPRTAQELGAVAGLHPSTVRFHLETLRRAGLVGRAMWITHGMGRPPIGYVPTSAATPDTAYEGLARLLAAHLSESATERADRAERAGADWAADVVPVQTPPLPTQEAAEHLSSVFAEIGFGPELSEVGDELHMRLHACPFRAAALAQPEICSVHRGLLLAGLDRLGAARSATLVPFVEREICLAVIGPNGEGQRDDGPR